VRKIILKLTVEKQLLRNKIYTYYVNPYGSLIKKFTACIWILMMEVTVATISSNFSYIGMWNHPLYVNKI
jgi:hypothetical protein